MPIKEAIWDARAKWKDIGRKLKLTEGDIDAIHKRDDGECLHRVLLQWIRTGRATMLDLLAALESKIIDRLDIVKKIQSLPGEKQTELGLTTKEYTSPESKYKLLSFI